MKRELFIGIYTLLSALYAPVKSVAQEHIWYTLHHYEHYTPGYLDEPEKLIYQNKVNCYKLGTDTLVDGAIWRKFYQNENYLGAFRNEADKIWFLPSKETQYNFGVEEDTPWLLYDFSLQVGERIYFNDYWLPGFTHEKTQEDVYLEVKEVREEYGRKIIDFGNEQWIEGIGSPNSPFLDRWIPRPTDGSNTTEKIFQVIRGEETIYFHGEIANPHSKSWLQSGMTWTENKNFSDTFNGFFLQTTLGKEVRPGTFELVRNDSQEKLPFTHLHAINNKVYGIGREHGNIYLCYDFSLQKGDKISLLSNYQFVPPQKPVFEYTTYQFIQSDSVEVNRSLQKRLILKGNEEEIVWIEGIGSLTRLFPLDEISNQTSYIYPTSRLTCCYTPEKSLYLHPDFTDCTTVNPNHLSYTLNSQETEIKMVGTTLTCTAPGAQLLQLYTLDSKLVEQTSFTNNQANIALPQSSSTYIYLIIYSDGERESGKISVK